MSTQRSLAYPKQHNGFPLSLSFFFFLPPTAEAIFWGCVWHQARHRVTETDSYPGRNSDNTLRGAGSQKHNQRHTKELTQDKYHGGSPEHQTRLGSGLRSITHLAMCTALPRPALSRARDLASGSGALREQVNVNCIPHRAYLSELYTDLNLSTQFRARSPSVKSSIPPSTYVTTQRGYTGRAPSHG